MGGEKNPNALRQGRALFGSVLATASHLRPDPIHTMVFLLESATPESPHFTHEEQRRPRVGKGPAPGREQVVSAELGPDIPGLPNQQAAVQGKRGLSMACHHG